MTGVVGVNDDRFVRKRSILDKYDIPVHHLDFEYIRNCRNVKELEKILKILRSKEEGYYPELIKCTEDQLSSLDSKNRLLRKESRVTTRADLSSEEWNSITDDLLLWKGDLERVDSKMAEHETCMVNGQIPNVRTSTKGFQNKKNGEVKDKKSQRIKSSDYKSWEQFDADEECKKMDLEEEIKEESAKEIEEIPSKHNKLSIEELAIQSLGDIGNLPLEEREAMALREKDIGNEFYNTNKIEESIKHYTRSVQLHLTVAGLNNRAAAYLRLCAFNKALDDLNKVLEMDPGNIKARFRRAQSFQHKNSFRDALDDINRVLLKQPNHHVAHHIAEQLRESIRKLPKMHKIKIFDKEARKTVIKTVTEMEMLNDYKNEKFIEVNDFGLPKIMCNCNGKHSNEPGIRHEEHVRLQHVRRHVPTVNKVVKTDGEKSDLEKLLTSTTTPAKTSFEIVEGQKASEDEEEWNDAAEGMAPLFEDGDRSACVVADMRTAKTQPLTAEVPPFNIISTDAQNSDESDEKSKKMGENEMIKDTTSCSGDFLSDRMKEAKTGKNMTIQENRLFNGDGDKYLEKKTESGIEIHPKGELPNSCGCIKPCNRFQFKRDWAGIKGYGSLERKAELLFSICPEHVIQSFGNSWDKDMLVDVMKCLLLHDNPQTNKRLSEYVQILPKLDRFKINYFFLSNDERSLAQELIKRCSPNVDSNAVKTFQI